MASPDQTGDATFRYNPLDLSKESIRLIRLQSGLPDDPITCELLEALLDDEGVPYSALSYTWGNSSDTRRIQLDGVHFKVTSNLYGALYNLRRQSEDRYLWADAVCIDQSNIDERNHQVGQMRRMYQHAENVVIWLGESTSDIDELLDSINDLDRRLLVDDAPMKLLWIERARPVWESKIQSSVKNKEDSNRRSKNAMKTLLARPWFNRIWVVQEAASAKAASIACGQKSAPTRTFALMSELLDIKAGGPATALLEAMPGPLRKLSWWNKKPNLETLLRKFYSCNATDPRDKIYALLGVAIDTAENKTALRANYQLDFKETLSETFYFLLLGDVTDLTLFEIPPHMLNLEFIARSDGDLRSRFQRWIGGPIPTPLNPSSWNPLWPPVRHLPPRITFSWIPMPPPVNTQELNNLLENPKSDFFDEIHHAQQLLLRAASYGQSIIVTSLLSKWGRLATSHDSDRMGALALAAQGGHLTCVQAIIPFEDARSYSLERYWGYHPFNLAVKMEHVEVMKEFINCSSRSHVPSKRTYEKLLAEAPIYEYSATVVKLLVDSLGHS